MDPRGLETPPDRPAPAVPVDQFRPKEIKVKAGSSNRLGRFAAKSPRLAGVGAIALGGLLYGIHEAMLASTNSYYPQILIFAPCLATLGVWMIATGMPVDPVTQKPRTWWRVGAGVLIALGILAGIALCVDASG